MKNLSFYKDVLKCKNGDEVFNYIISTLKPSNRLWSYFVNWEKVFENTRNFELSLNLLNYLIGKKNFDDEFRFLLKKSPNVIKAIPALIAKRGGSKKFKILVEYKEKRLVYENFDFDKNNPTKKDIEKYLTFVKETGLKDLIISKRIKNLVDYMIGVEAGLDSNARKNRGGKAMENIVEVFIDDICQRHGFEYLKEANSEKIYKAWGYKVPVDRASRRYDFAINNRKELFLIEVNFYGGGGSKLKSTAGEYQNLYNVLKGKYEFIWITDGLGWKVTSKPLRETFDNNDFVLNLSMLEKDILNFLIC